MSNDDFIQDILIRDEQERIRYSKPKTNRKLFGSVKKLAHLKRVLWHADQQIAGAEVTNKHAVFSKTTVDGSVDAAIADMWERIQTKPKP